MWQTQYRGNILQHKKMSIFYTVRMPFARRNNEKLFQIEYCAKFNQSHVLCDKLQSFPFSDNLSLSGLLTFVLKPGKPFLALVWIFWYLYSRHIIDIVIIIKVSKKVPDNIGLLLLFYFHPHLRLRFCVNTIEDPMSAYILYIFLQKTEKNFCLIKK